MDYQRWWVPEPESPAWLDGNAEGLLLAATGGGRRLSLVVAGLSEISMWTMWTEARCGGWSRQVVIGKWQIGERRLVVGQLYGIRFQGFGERSGTVLFWVDGTGLVQLDVQAKNAVVLHGCTHRGATVEWACMHEVDLVAVLRDMKPF
ncbi:hypothetical protein ACP4OV_008286 [Aristida adscensionis]